MNTNISSNDTDNIFAPGDFSIIDVINYSNIYFILWFLAIYLIIFFILGIFNVQSGTVTNKLLASRTLDFFVFVFLLVYIVFNYKYWKNNMDGNLSTIKSYIDYPYSFISIILFLFVFYLLIFVTDIPMSSDAKPFSIILIETGAWISLFIVFIIDFFKYFLGIPITDVLYNFFTGKLKKIHSGDDAIFGKSSGSDNKGKEPEKKNEVFNISNNIYSYDDAKSVCSVFGARLANYDEIEDAYKNGGEWCNYGWSEGQMAYFPTQKSTWLNLQSNPKTKNNCGRPGINGGYMANPKLKFGVNCYGIKPKPTDADLKRMQTPAVSTSDPEEDKKVKFLKENSYRLLNLNSFGQNKWSEW